MPDVASICMCVSRLIEFVANMYGAGMYACIWQPKPGHIRNLAETKNDEHGTPWWSAFEQFCI